MMSGSDSMNEYIYWAYYLSMSQIQSSVCNPPFFSTGFKVNISHLVFYH